MCPRGRGRALVQDRARGVTAFYDIDTPVTLAKLDRGDFEYLSPELIPAYDIYFSFTGGPILDRLETQYRIARSACALLLGGPERLPETIAQKRWDLTYLGTYSADRQPTLERLLLEPARRAPHLRFAVAGPLYPAQYPVAAQRRADQHVPPTEHRGILFAQPVHPERDPRRHDRAGYQPERPAVRGGGVSVRRSSRTCGMGSTHFSSPAAKSLWLTARGTCSM